MRFAVFGHPAPGTHFLWRGVSDEFSMNRSRDALERLLYFLERPWPAADLKRALRSGQPKERRTKRLGRRSRRSRQAERR